MDLNAELAGMAAGDLRVALFRTDLLLQDVLEEKAFTLGQTGVHIGASELARLHRAWERDETRYRGRIAAINARLAELESAP